ncbi:hypothetical protein V6N13_009960 [Hibiscus sabdariffa]
MSIQAKNILPPRSAPTAAPPRLTPRVLRPPPGPPTHRGLALAPKAGYRHALTRTLLRRSRSIGGAPTPWSVFQDGPDGEPAGRRPEHAGAEARRDGACWVPRSRRLRLHGRIKGPGFGRHHDPRRSTPRADRRTGSRRSTSNRGASPAPIRFPPDNFKHSLTLFSKSFSSFPHGTCSLSVSRPYLALDGIYRPIRAAFPNNPTRRQCLVVRQGPGTTGLSPSPVPLSRGLGPGPPLRTLLQTTIRTLRESFKVSFPPLIDMLKLSGSKQHHRLSRHRGRQDLHRRPLCPGSCPGFYCDRRALLLIGAWPLPRRPGIGHALKRHPFSGLVDSAVLLTKNGPLGALDSVAWLNEAAVPSYLFKTPWSVFQDGPDGEPAGRRPEHAGAEARQDGACWVPRSRRRRLHGRIKGPGLGRHHDPRRSTPRADRRTGSRRSTSDRGASPAPIRFPPDNFKHSLTLFSKSFSSFLRGTCSLSVSRPYLALDGICRPIRAAFPNNPTRRQCLVVRQGPGMTGLSPSPAPLSRGLGPGPPLRTLLQTTIRTPRATDFQAGLFPVRSPLLTESL